MQTPSVGTPVSKCVELATYSIRMFGKFSTNTVLAALAAEMTTVKNHLVSTQNDYEVAMQDILPARVDVKYENYVSDRRIGQTRQKAEMTDGKKGGRIVTLVFPNGSSPITRLLGDSQVTAMANLEGRLEAAVSLWPEAATEKADIARYREAYQTALRHREAVGQNVRDKRALRTAAKEVFILKYVEITNRVKAEFPGDTAMQDLFFDEVRGKSALAEADGDASGDTTEDPRPQPTTG